MKIVTKPWGKELWWAVTNQYVGKEIHVNGGQRLSLQYHNVKEETMYILEGEGVIFLDNELLPYKKGDVFHIEPTVVHRVETFTDTIIIEVSTPQVDDIVRLQDDYNR